MNGGERGAEFMGNVGHEITANAFEFAQRSNVVQNDDRAGSFSRADGSDGGGKEMLTKCSSNNFGFNARFPGKNAANGIN